MLSLSVKTDLQLLTLDASVASSIVMLTSLMRYISIGASDLQYIIIYIMDIICIDISIGHNL